MVVQHLLQDVLQTLQATECACPWAQKLFQRMLTNILVVLCTRVYSSLFAFPFLN
jgi:hypothetical protein